MTLFNLVIILSAIILPIVAADSPTLTSKTVGTSLVLSSSSTLAALPKVGVPLHQQPTANGGIVGTTLAVQSSQVSVSSSSTLSTATSSPSNAPKVGTPKPNSATTTTSASVANSTGGIRWETALSITPIKLQFSWSSHFRSYRYRYFCDNCFLDIGCMDWLACLWTSQSNNKQRDVEDEDALEAYSKYWKGKRNSGGNVAKGNDISSPVDEKVGNKTNV